MKHQTHTLTGADLNRAVAMALGKRVRHTQTSSGANRWCWECTPGYWIEIPNYAGDISVAWSIIKGRRIGIEQGRGDAYAYMPGKALEGQFDPDPQVAALRAFVASVYGDEVELP